MILGLVTLANAAIYLLAAALHWGARLQLGPVTLAFPEAIRPATVVEGVIGIALLTGGVAVLGHLGPYAAWIWVVYGIALAGTLFGLAIALARHLAGPDIAVHLVMLAGLAIGFGILLIDGGVA
jgi:hypothetical protein